MKKTSEINRIEQFVIEQYDDVKQNLIIKDNGVYYVFDAYTIAKLNNLTFTVAKSQRDPKKFSSLKSAISWCIADKFGQLDLAVKIHHLDCLRSDMLNDLQVRQELARKITDRDRKEAVDYKIRFKKHSFELVEKQLSKCINLAKYWQIKGFNRDETSRTR